MDRINWVTKDCFYAIAQLRRMAPQGATQPEVIHGRLRSYVDATMRRATEAGYSEAERRSITYALVALADEAAMASPGPLRDFWGVRPLQLAYFSENLAGENFFAELDRLRQSPERVDVLRVYYACLAFGFQGKYGVRGAEFALADLVESVRTQLTRQLPMPEVLSPSGLRPEEGVLARGARFPVVWLGLAMLALSSVLYLGLQVAIRDQTRELLTWISKYTGGI